MNVHCCLAHASIKAKNQFDAKVFREAKNFCVEHKPVAHNSTTAAHTQGKNRVNTCDIKGKRKDGSSTLLAAGRKTK
jgi:hypothetical protein